MGWELTESVAHDRMPFCTSVIGNHTDKALDVQEPMRKGVDTSVGRLLACISLSESFTCETRVILQAWRGQGS